MVAARPETEAHPETPLRSGPRTTPGSSLPGTRICPLSRPARNIGLGVNQLIGVGNPSRVPGPSLCLQRMPIEKMTSPAKDPAKIIKIVTNSFTVQCMSTMKIRK